ncbi:hypothetical protein FQA39_LY10352 [Lamprigera yunnana]|nr:hypothetical protein FQA39_LY10352 [Lamprigera yunnana]
MFRVFKSFIKKSAFQSWSIDIRNHQRAWSMFLLPQRFYTKKSTDDDCSCKVKTPECKIPKPILPECKADSELHPCTPKPIDCGFGKKTLPLYHDCATSNKITTLPKLQCPHKKPNGKRKKTYLYVLLLGAVVLLVTLGSLYQVQKPKMELIGKKKLIKRLVKNPPKSKVIPTNIKYLLIGGGTASFSAFRAIKSADPDARILIISEESDFPYMRPPLSKELWATPDSTVNKLTFRQWNGSERSLYYEPEEFYTPCEKLQKETSVAGVSVAKGWKVTHVDVIEKRAYLEDGHEICYEQCLIATGSSPKNLSIFENASDEIKERVMTYREIFDFQKMHQICEDADSIAIIGGGFLGSELACSLAKKGKNKFNVTQIFREGGNMGKVLPEYLSFWTTNKVEKEGVIVKPYAEVTGVTYTDSKLKLNLSNGDCLQADYVIVATGALPNTTIAEKSKLELDPDLGGYLVNTELQARSNLYIAGDCACFYDTKLGRRRVEHHDHAVVSGRLAGENMTGAAKPYLHQSMFWSDLGCEVGYEAIGIVDSSLPTVGVFVKPKCADNSDDCTITETDEGNPPEEEKIPPECEPYIQTNPEIKKLAEIARKESVACGDYDKGVIFYLRDDTVVGIVLWNIFNRMNTARQVLKDERKYCDLNEVAKLFNIHED